MKRLTTNNPSDNLSQLLNFAYADGEHVKLAYAGMRYGADLCEYISGEAGDAGLTCAPSPDDVMEGSCIECDCIFGVLNNVAIQAAELRARLMKIEDILGEDYNLEHLRELVEAERRWIPVEEGLPDEDVRVIVRIDRTVWNTAFELDADRQHNGEWVRWGRAVTNWMPMPVKEG